MYCKSCGTELKDSSKFCHVCGASLDENPQSQQVKPKDNKLKELAIVALLIAFAALLFFMQGVFNNIEPNKVSQENNNITATEEVKLIQKVDTSNAVPAQLEITQIDTSKFPEISMYFSMLESNGVPVINLIDEGIEIFEDAVKITDGISLKTFKDVPISVSLIMDNSGSMEGYPIEQAKNAAKTFFSYVDFNNNDRVEVTEFNSSVYVRLPYSTDLTHLNTAINTIETTGGTALFDALYTGLVRAYSQTGPKCIIAFTDGADNESSKSIEEVISLAKEVSIPVYIIGVGSQINEENLRYLAETTGGSYYYSPSADELSNIYKEVYNNQKTQYVVTYKTKASADNNSWLNAALNIRSSRYIAEAEKSFIITPSVDLPVELMFSSVTASSTLPPEKDPTTKERFDYLPYHAIDNNPSTAWVENAKGSGIGEWLKIDFIRPIQVSGMYIHNGYFRIEPRLGENNRVKKIRIHFSDGTSEVFDLPDPLTEDFETMKSNQGYYVKFNKKVLTSSVKVEILDVYKGTRWDDTCISEILLFN